MREPTRHHDNWLNDSDAYERFCGDIDDAAIEAETDAERAADLEIDRIREESVLVEAGEES